MVGDLHGAFHLLVSAMRMVKFDKAVDRILSVGDLIDRGQDSGRVLEFLEQHFVFAIRGNHEEHFIRTSIDNLRLFARVNRHGLGWLSELDTSHIEEIQHRLLRLPIVMEVQTDSGVVGLVHADIPKGMDWKTFVELVASGCTKTCHTAQNGRLRIENNDCTGIDGIDRVFVGHSVMKDGPARFGNVYAIDTGAVYYTHPEEQGSLTLVRINGNAFEADSGFAPMEQKTTGQYLK